MRYSMIAALLLFLSPVPVSAGAQNESELTTPVHRDGQNSGGLPLILSQARGGAHSYPVIRGDHVYIGSGTTVTTWDYSDPAEPERVHATWDEPLQGPIQAMAAHGDYLYATWNRPDDTSAVAVYSIEDPAAPQLLVEIDDYHDSDFSGAGAIGVINDYLVFNDSQLGLHASDLSNPAHPEFDLVYSEFIDYGRFFVEGDWLVTTGQGWLGDTFLTVFDFTDPNDPEELGQLSIIENTSFRLDVAGTLAAGFGTHFEIYDFSDPSNMELRASIELDEPLTGGAIHGDFAYGGGRDELRVWDISDPDDPVELNAVDMDTFGLHAVSPTDHGPLLVTRKDRAMLIDSSDPGEPGLLSDVVLPGGYGVIDLVQADDYHLMVQQDYGYTVHEPGNPEVLTQFDADLPLEMSARAFYTGQPVDDHVYLASWGTGILAVDASDPLDPVQVDTAEFPFATALDVQGDMAYTGSTTNGGVFGILDASKPASPQLIGSMETSQTFGLEVHGDYAFTSEGSTFGPGGLYVIDVSDPTDPELVSNYGGCDSASDVTVDTERSLAFLACSDGDLHLVDISDLEAPVQVSVYSSHDGFSESDSVARMGTRVLFGNRFGVDVVDTSQPESPEMLQRLETPWPPRNIVVADEKVYAFTGPAGMFVFEVVGDEIFHSRFEADDQ